MEVAVRSFQGEMKKPSLPLSPAQSVRLKSCSTNMLLAVSGPVMLVSVHCDAAKPPLTAEKSWAALKQLETHMLSTLMTSKAVTFNYLNANICPCNLAPNLGSTLLNQPSPKLRQQGGNFC